MERNRLQVELERMRGSAGVEVIDLSDTSFHANGLRFPDFELRGLFEDYLRNRSYRPEPKGALPAREAVSEYYSRNGVSVSPGQIIITASTSEAYGLLFSSLADAGDNVVLPKPTYPLFEYLAEYSRLEARYYEMRFEDSFKIDPDSVRRKIDGNTRFVVLISPNNPTGQIADTDEVKALLDICETTGTMLISDEVFSEMSYPGFGRLSGQPVPRPAGLRSTVPVFTLNGISKMFASPDLKLGWIAVSGDPIAIAEPLERLEVANDTFLSCTSLTQHILPGLFAKGAGLMTEMNGTLLGNRDQLLSSLGVALSVNSGAPAGPLVGTTGLRIVAPTGGIHAVIGVPRGPRAKWHDDEDFAVALLKSTGVYLHPGYFYGIEESEDELYVVVSFLKRRALLEEGVARLVSFVSGADRVD